MQELNKRELMQVFKVLSINDFSTECLYGKPLKEDKNGIITKLELDISTLSSPDILDLVKDLKTGKVYKIVDVEVHHNLFNVMCVVELSLYKEVN